MGLTKLVDKVLGDEVLHEVMNLVGAGVKTVVDIEKEDWLFILICRNRLLAIDIEGIVCRHGDGGLLQRKGILKGGLGANRTEV